LFRTTVREHHKSWEVIPMPAKPLWFLHIREIRSMLEEVSLPVIDRAVIQRVFCLGRRQAIKLMHKLGASQAGRTFLIERSRLVAELDKIIATGEYQQEEARREKLTAALARFQRTRRAEVVRIPVSGDVFGSGMSTVPEAVHLQPGRLEVSFTGCEDLLKKLFALAQAAANDFDAFRERSDGSGRGRGEGGG